MATYISDTFTAANGTAISAHTPNVGGAWGGTTFQINNNTVAIPGNFVSMSTTINATAMGSADFDVSMDILAVTATTGNGDWLGVMGRGVPGAGNFYAAYYNGSYGGTAQQVRLSKFVGNGETILGTYSLAYVQGVTHNLKFRLQGTTLSVLIDGTTQISLTDSTYTTGTTVGIISATNFNMALAGDNFLATDVGGGSTTITPVTIGSTVAIPAVTVTGNHGVGISPLPISCTTSIPVVTVAAGGGGGPVTFDAVGPSSSGTSSTGSATLSWSHTCSGSNRLLTVVGIWNPNAMTDTGITMSATYNGVAMTSVGTVHPGNDVVGFVQMWQMVAPPTGAHTVVITASSAPDNGIAGGSVSFNNADQTTPTQNFTTTFDTGATAKSITVTSATNNMVVAAAGYGGGSVPSTTKTAGWLGGIAGSAGGSNHGGEIYTAGATSVVMDFTGSANDYWGLIGVDIRAAAGATSNATITPVSISCTTTIPAPLVRPRGYVQSIGHATSGSVTTNVATLPNAVTAGNLLVIDAYWRNTSATCSFTDNHSNTWTAIGTPVTGTGGINVWRFQQFYAQNCAAGSTTVTGSLSLATTGTGFTIAITEVEGRSLTAALDPAAHTVATRSGSSPATSASVTPSQNNSYIHTFIAIDGTLVTGVNTPFVMRAGFDVDGNGTGDYLQATAAATSSTWTMTGTNATQVMGIAAFAPSGTSATAFPVSISCTTAIPAVAVAGNTATITPVSISARVVIPPLIAQVSPSIASILVAGTTAIPAPGITAGSIINVNITPVSISATTGIPPLTGASISSTATPVSISAVTSIPAPTVSRGAQVTTSPITATTSIPRPTILSEGVVSMSASAGMNVGGAAAQFGTVNMLAGTTLNVGAAVTEIAAVTMTATAGLAPVVALVTEQATVFLSGTAGLLVQGTTAGGVSAFMTATAGLSLTPVVATTGTIFMPATTTLLVSAAGAPAGVVNFLATTTLNVTGAITVQGAVSMLAAAGLTVTSSVTVIATVSLSAVTGLTLSVTTLAGNGVQMLAITGLTVNTFSLVMAQVNMFARAGLTVIAAVESAIFTMPTLAEQILAVAGQDPMQLGATGYVDTIFSQRMLSDTE